MATGSGFRVQVRGVAPVVRALNALPRNAQREAKDGSERLARDLANVVRAAGRAEGRQARRASRTVRVARGLWPIIVAGPHPMLFGSEFGMTRRSGWYARGRYYHSTGKQYRPHLGSGSYWFFRTQREERPRIVAAHQQMVDNIVGSWGA
ncbi:hypothetical protein ACU61A_15710 [Pseudonocardia sichuanensis]